ncbi:probable BOI-related E3 ubiquitin-protein ligase 3 [Tanacetum coccineum]
MMMRNMEDESIDTKLHNGSIIYNNTTQFGYYTQDYNESLNCVPVLSRKRSRDNNSYSNSQTMFLGQDIMMISSQIHQQQPFEIDQFIKHHSENVRLEIEAKRRKNSRTLIAALEEGLQHQLRAKEDEIAKMMKLNHALEEKVKTMCIENQIWRELAQTNEATANALRNNLKYVLDYKLGDDEDAESCCESSNDISLQHDSACKTTTILNPVGCAPSIDFCPICKSTKNITLNENHGEDSYNDDDFDDLGLTDAQIKFVNAFDINLRGQFR